MRQMFGSVPRNDVTLFYTACIDETGTSGQSPYVIVAGGLTLNEQWDYFESAWGNLLSKYHVELFHAKEFNGSIGDFSGWSRLKRERFVKAQKKIIDQASLVSVAVAVESKTHREIKQQMRGVSGFLARSDYGLCFSFLRIMICDQLAKGHPDSKLRLIVEDGPYSSGAAKIYTDVRKTIGAKYRPAPHADMLNGFGILPKGSLRGLEVADYFADKAIVDLRSGAFKTEVQTRSIRAKLTPTILERWYNGMIKEKEHRKKLNRSGFTGGSNS